MAAIAVPLRRAREVDTRATQFRRRASKRRWRRRNTSASRRLENTSSKRIRGSGFQPPKCIRPRRCYDSYKHRLFANEIMLPPYYLAALNIEHAFFEQAGTYEAFEGLCFVDTLDLANQPQGQLGFMTAANTQ